MKINQIAAVVQYGLTGIQTIFFYHLGIRLDDEMKPDIPASCRSQHGNQIRQNRHITKFLKYKIHPARQYVLIV